MGDFNRGNRSDSRHDFGRRDFGNRGFGGSGRREMHQAVCSNCGRNCEVPFAPTGSRPVYCSECFEKIGGGASPRRFQDRGPRRPDFERRHESRPQNNDQLDQINRKLDKIMAMLSVAPVKKEKVFIKENVIKTMPVAKTLIATKKTKVLKKKTPVVKE